MYLSSHPLDGYRPAMDALTTATVREFDETEKALRDGVVPKKTVYVVAGLVTETEFRTSKNGNPYLRFTLEDFSGSHAFALFGRDYESMAPMVTAGGAFLLRADVAHRRSRDGETDELELRTRRVMPLADARDELIREVRISYPLDSSDRGLRDRIKAAVERNPGNARLVFDVLFSHDGKDDSVRGTSVKYNVMPTVDLVTAFLEEGLRVRYAVADMLKTQ